MKIADIAIQNRVRRDLGNIDDLCKSIEEVGLLQPIVVTKNNRLVAGERRVKAFEKLGHKDIPAVVVENLSDAVLLLKAERDENTCRLPFRPTEAVALGEELEKLERPKAAERKAQAKGKPRGSKNVSSGKLPQETNGKAKTRDVVAEAVGMKGKTYEKAKAVVKAAAKEPDKFAAVAAKMDATGNVDKAFKEVKRHEKEQQRAKAAKEAAKATPPKDYGVFHGDFRKVSESLKDDSVDLIFTDPPYDRGSLPLYDEIAKVAARVLKPGGSLICYLGSVHLHEVLNRVTPHLRYWWNLCCLHTGESTRMREHGIVVKWKPMLWFVKGTRGDKETFIDDLVVSNREKDVHEWQQGITEAAYYIERLTSPGDLVFDPCCGGGTTAVACSTLNRRWLTCDVDLSSVSLARKRIHDASEAAA